MPRSSRSPSASQPRTRSESGTGSRALSTTRVSRSIATRSNERSVARSWGARTKSRRGTGGRPCSTRSSRPASSTQSIRRRLSRQQSAREIEMKFCSAGGGTSRPTRSRAVARFHDERDQTSHPRAASRRRRLRRCPGRSRLRELRGAGPTQSWRAYRTSQQRSRRDRARPYVAAVSAVLDLRATHESHRFDTFWSVFARR